MRLQEHETVQERELGEKRIRHPKNPNAPTRKTFVVGVAITVLIGIVATFLAPLPGLAIMGSLTVALLLGLAWRSVIGLPTAYAGGVKFSAQKLLRYGIILTGVRLNFALIVASGVKVLLLDTLLIAFGVGVVPLLVHKLGLSKRLAFLIGVGQSICGASAVGAMAALFPDMDEDDVSLAVAVCGLIGTVGVLVFTFGARLLTLPVGWYGLLTGSTLHEIAQVVAAGAAASSKEADLAMVVKLTRVMLLAPVALLVAFIFSLRAEKRSEQTEHRGFNWQKIPMPWFVFGFLAVGAANSLGLFPKSLANIILQASVFLLVVAMAAMGLMVDLTVIRKTGLRALGVATLVFAVFVGMSGLLISLLGRL
ncbi:MAG: putative sulfate exporter family transporter [Ktedonobacteraceae bacterium]